MHSPTSGLSPHIHVPPNKEDTKCSSFFEGKHKKPFNGKQLQSSRLSLYITAAAPKKKKKERKQNQRALPSRELHLSFRVGAFALRLSFRSVVVSLVCLSSPLVTFSSRVVVHVQLRSVGLRSACSFSPWRSFPSLGRWVGTADDEDDLFTARTGSPAAPWEKRASVLPIPTSPKRGSFFPIKLPREFQVSHSENTRQVKKKW